MSTEWYCSGCQFKNFKSRTTCKECGKQRSNEDSNKKLGDWDCPKCAFVNFASRSECKNCGANKGDKKEEIKVKKENVEKTTSGVEQDWKCVCGFVNFKNRTGCKNCDLSREDAKKKEVDVQVLQQTVLDMKAEIEKLKKRVDELEKSKK